MAVATGDLNNDGKPDLAVANYGASRLSTLLANGDGTFAAAQVYSYGNNPMGVVAVPPAMRSLYRTSSGAPVRPVVHAVEASLSSDAGRA